MAVQNLLHFSGKAGNIVFVNRNGQTYIRSMPVRVKRSAASKRSSVNFGIAAAAGKTLRSQLGYALPTTTDKYMYARFTGAISRWLGSTLIKDMVVSNSIPYVRDFNFNPATSIRERCRISFTVTRISNHTIRINLPGFIPENDISAPAHTVSLECNITTASCRLADGVALGNASRTINIPFNGVPIPAQSFNLAVSNPKGSVVITAVSMVFYVNKKGLIAPVNNANFIPGSIISAMYI